MALHTVLRRSKGPQTVPSPTVVSSGKRERLVVEHENGRIEDHGFVELAFVARDSRKATCVLQWRGRSREASGAVPIPVAEIAGDSIKRPLEVKMRSGERQFWYFGDHAQARVAALRHYQRQYAKAD